MPNYLCNDVENGGKNVEQLVRIERSSLTNIWRALCADCIPVEILLPTFIGVEICFDKLSCPYVWYMSIVYFSINRLPNMCFIKFTFKYPWMRKTSMSGFSMLLMTSRKTRRNRRTELSFGLAAPIELITSFPPHRRQRQSIVALRSSSAVLNLFMLSSSGQMVKIWISETDKHKYLFWPSGKLISFLSWQAAATQEAEKAERCRFRVWSQLFATC